MWFVCFCMGVSLFCLGTLLSAPPPLDYGLQDCIKLTTLADLVWQRDGRPRVHTVVIQIITTVAFPSVYFFRSQQILWPWDLGQFATQV